MEYPVGSQSINLRKYFWITASVWSIFVLAILAWNSFYHKKEMYDVALNQARNVFQKDLLYRRWAAEHGGVYVPVTKETPPNPYLSDVKERDIVTLSGRNLTLVNPAYMTRQVHELGLAEYGLKGHITSLNPLRPENVPDEWERKALIAFDEGATEISSVEDMDNQKYLRMMRPMFTEKGCLKCHAKQGYKVGDIRGGISISVPLASLWAIVKHQMVIMSFGHFILWLLGLVGIAIAARHLKCRISERDKAQEELKKEKEQAEQYLDIAEIGMGIVDSDENIVLINKKGCKALKYDQEELIGKNWFELMVPHNIREEVREIFHQLLEGSIGLAEFHENPLLTRDGEERLFSFHNTVIRGTNDQICGVLFSAEDITDRKRVEFELKQERDNFTNIFEAIQDGMYIVDQNYNIQYINPVLLKSFGPVEGRKCYQYFHEDDNVCSWCKNAEVLAGKTVQWEWYSEKNGKTYDLLDTPVKNPDGSISKLEIFRDITERKKAESALQAKTHDLGERVKELNCLFDLSKLIDKHDSLEAVFSDLVKIIPSGWQYPEITCCRINALGSEFKSSDFEQTEWQQSSEIVVNDQPSGQIEVFYKQQRPEGDEGPFIKEERDLIDVLAERLGNIIERKLAIQKAYMHQLETAHASRVNSIGEMASSLAHEINHPLFVMQAQAERSAKLLESGSQNIDNVIDKMQIIIKQADRAQKIISRIRGFVRKGKSERQKVSLNELINNSLDLLQIEMKNKKIKLQLDLSKNGLEVNTDPVQIEQVIVNLINNSIDALDETPENDRQISIKSSMLQGNAEVRIKDNGSGMSPKEMQIAFDSFYTTKSNGLGMGLSISRSIIESQGGRIGLEFNADKGITSYFTLPVKKTS